MTVLREYKCPHCHEVIPFDGIRKKLSCPCCGAEFRVETLHRYNEIPQDDGANNMKWKAHTGYKWHSAETYGMCAYICKQCGSELIGHRTESAVFCPHCNNVLSTDWWVGDDLRPDYIIPFKLDKEAAKARFKKYLKSKHLLPGVFKKRKHINQIKGIYVPFWLFDADVKAHVYYKPSRVYEWIERRSKNSCNKCTRTSYYLAMRKGDIKFKNIPMDSSKRIPNNLMEFIEPFDLSDMVEFQSSYLEGYITEKCDVSAEQSILRVNKRIKDGIENAFVSTVYNYDCIITKNIHTELLSSNIKYALYPVWLTNIMWHGNKYTIAMNGQTGKITGELPVSKLAYWKWLFVSTGIVSAVTFAVFYLLWLL